MDWTDDGIVLSARKHGETSVIASLLTRAHGRHLGLVRGGAGKKARGIYQPGNRVTGRWRARLAEQLGTFSCEMTSAFAAEQGIAERLRKGRALLLGDAAHVVSPIGGQGMNLGWLGPAALIPLLPQILNSTAPEAPALSAWERQVRSNWQRARRRAEANMFHGRPLRCPQLHRALMHLMLDTPLRHRFVRHYTMDGFT